MREFLPQVDLTVLPSPDRAKGRTCLVVDVLRATSMCAALFSCGAHRVYPVASIEQARQVRSLLQSGTKERVLLCGEVGAVPPADFDLGNSPTELLERGIRPHTVVLATTNGTGALLSCAAEKTVIAAAVVNASAAVEVACRHRRDLLVVCSGSDGRVGRDDLLAAGTLVELLSRRGVRVTPAAQRARDLYREAQTDLSSALAATSHGARLIAKGFSADVALCASLDRFDVAPVLIDVCHELPPEAGAAQSVALAVVD